MTKCSESHCFQGHNLHHWVFPSINFLLKGMICTPNYAIKDIAHCTGLRAKDNRISLPGPFIEKQYHVPWWGDFYTQHGMHRTILRSHLKTLGVLLETNPTQTSSHDFLFLLWKPKHTKLTLVTILCRVPSIHLSSLHDLLQDKEVKNKET